jgi:Na+-transporting NADH:ubiquinone oxidoreductase subunit A
MHIKTTKGLNIPIKGAPRPLPLGSEIPSLATPTHLALDLTPFDDVKFKVLVAEGERVKLGQPLAEDKAHPGRYFVSPAGGVVREVRRGLKRRLLDIVIDVAKEEEHLKHPPLNLSQTSREELIDFLKLGGVFTNIRQRPFNFLAHPNKAPRSIFVKALESEPFVPPAEMQVYGYEKEFQTGLDALLKLTDGQVNLVYHADTNLKAFSAAQGVVRHTAEGPDPIASPSLHIEKIDPIYSAQDILWVLNAHTVVAIGYLVLHGERFVNRVISIAGPGMIEGKTGYFRTREGYPISHLIEGRLSKGWVRLISGSPLSGKQVEATDFLGYDDYCFCSIPENATRELLHFFRLGLNKFSISRAYLSGHLDNKDREYDFTTNQHGERRAFIDGSLYDQVMPLAIPTMPLVKAVMGEDYDRAVELGLLQVDSEDFALATFVDPSKIEMVDIMRRGLRNYAADILK